MVEVNPYWYARGYYDGRSTGIEDGEIYSLMSERVQACYKQGYEMGVSDHCVLDMNDDVDKQKETV